MLSWLVYVAFETGPMKMLKLTSETPLKVDDKSNEITAVPMLMDQLDLKGTIITADALNTQKTIAAKAIQKEADYLLPVKANHPNLLQEIELAFQGVDQERKVKHVQWE